jgi:hypothetical protein
MRTMVQTSQRDVVFNSFMLRVRDLLDGEDCSTPLRLRPSSLHAIAYANDEWFYLRARSEQVIAEANAMIGTRDAPLDLEDEYGTGHLSFVLRHGDRSARISLGQTGRQGWVELQRPYAGDVRAVEPQDPDVLEDLVVELLTDGLPAAATGGKKA